MHAIPDPKSVAQDPYVLFQIRNPWLRILDPQTLDPQSLDPQTLESQTRCILFQI